MSSGDRKLPYFKFYPSDFMGSGKVQMMSPTERGIYISLLCQEWQEGHLPDDPTRLARISGASREEMEDAWPLVRECFQEDENGYLYHPRLEKEREDAVERMERRQKMSEAGRKGAAKRWAGRDANSPPKGGESNGGSTTRRSDASDAQRSHRSKGEMHTVGSEDVKSSGEDADVENPPEDEDEPWNDRLAPLIREVAYLGQGPPEGHELKQCLSKARQILDRGYSVEDLEDAIRGLRRMAETKQPEVRDWIGPEDRFRMLAFDRAEAQGQKLVQLAAHHYRKHGLDPPEKRRGGRPQKLEVG